MYKGQITAREYGSSRIIWLSIVLYAVNVALLLVASVHVFSPGSTAVFKNPAEYEITNSMVYSEDKAFCCVPYFVESYPE